MSGGSSILVTLKNKMQCLRNELEEHKDKLDEKSVELESERAKGREVSSRRWRCGLPAGGSACLIGPRFIPCYFNNAVVMQFQTVEITMNITTLAMG